MCVANSARSQLAEGLAKKVFGGSATIESAGSQPSRVNPLAVKALDEIGIDIRNHSSKSYDKLPPTFLENLDYVITLCAEEVCPTIVSKAKKLHWPLPDPANKEGTQEAQLERFRQTREAILKKLEVFSRELKG